MLPEAAQERLFPLFRRVTAWPPIGLVRFGSLGRLTPISDSFGLDRGQPIDRYYIEDFLTRHAGVEGYAPAVIRGRVLEVGEQEYVRTFGNPGAIDQIDVLDVSADNVKATIVGDLSDGTGIPSDAFDCVICTQTLLLIYDVHAAVQTLHRMLRPGGTLLVTVPGISQICRPDMDLWGDYWRFTTLSTRRLLEEAFRPEDVVVESYGNVLTATAFLYGLTTKDVKRSALDVRDPSYQVLIAGKATKRPG